MSRVLTLWLFLSFPVSGAFAFNCADLLGEFSPVSFLGDRGPGMLIGNLSRGAAIITKSGNLESTGITAIVHTAIKNFNKTGDYYKATSEGIENAVANSVRLAELNGHKRIAIPLMATDPLFANKLLGPEHYSQLAVTIVRAANGARKNIEIRFIGDMVEATFLKNAMFLTSVTDFNAVNVVSGSITDFKIHGASAIVNPTNMEVVFDPHGVSAEIGAATGIPGSIAHDVKEIIRTHRR